MTIRTPGCRLEQSQRRGLWINHSNHSNHVYPIGVYLLPTAMFAPQTSTKSSTAIVLQYGHMHAGLTEEVAAEMYTRAKACMGCALPHPELRPTYRGQCAAAAAAVGLPTIC